MVWHADRLQDAARKGHDALREREQLTVQIRHLHTELDDAISACAAAEGRRAHYCTEAQESVARARAANLEMKHQLDTANACATSLRGELQQVESSNKRLAEQAARSTADASQAATRLSDAQQAHADEVRSLEAAAQAAEAQLREQAEQFSLDVEAERKESQIQQAGIHSQLEELRNNMAAKVALAEEPLRSQVHGLQVELRAERAMLLSNVQTHKHDLASVNTQMAKLEALNEQLRSDVSDSHGDLKR
jgi:uncharacterized protein involved in exopolysaccharide biosynthesis